MDDSAASGSERFVRLEVAAGVGTIRLDRPPVNAMNALMQDQLHAVALEAAARDDVRAVVIYGGPRSFAAGADVKEMAAMTPRRHGRARGADAGSVHRGCADSEARRCCDHRLRARRRLRAGAGRRRAFLRGRREAGAAGNAARCHSWGRRHAAARATDRAGARKGTGFHRPHGRRRRGVANRPRRQGATVEQVYEAAIEWAGQFAAAQPSR